MTDTPTKVRQNYWAILVAAIACFLFETGWYTLFLKPWLSGIGRTMQWLEATGVNPLLQYGVALLASGVTSTTISRITQLTGPQTALRGIRIAVLLWAGIVLTTTTTEYVFEARPLSLYGINEGFWLLGMILMGAIVGGWKKKS